MRVWLARALALGTLLVAQNAAAQNADPFFFGDEAALASGAVVASGRDSGSFWYNPAGLGGLDRGLVSASASTFGIRVRKVPDAYRFRLGGRSDKNALSSADVISVPNAIVAATKIGDRYTLAGGLLTTQRDVRSGLIDVNETSFTSLGGEQRLVARRLDVQTDTSKYHFGAAFAAELSKRLRVGGAAYGTYTKSSYSVQSALSIRTPAPPPEGISAFFLSNGRTTTSALGVAGAIGAQYEVTDTISLGLTVRSPEVALTQTSEGGNLGGTSITGGAATPESTIARGAPSDGRAGRVIAPTRILAGVAFALGPPMSFIEVGVDFAHGLPASEQDAAQRPTVNARVGVRYMLSTAWSVGGGLFSDRAATKNLGELVSGEKVDWYGLTAGVTKRTPLALTENPSPDALVLVTTLSLRAGAGFGSSRAIDFNLDDPSAPVAAESDVTFFELMPYLGSAVLF